MNYSQSLGYLSRVQEQGAKLALENIQKIIDHLPFDLSRIKFIQIAGTNGKGSTSHFITSILQTAGRRVGLFTSPHLQDIRERITINKQWISQREFADSLSAVRELCTELLDRRVIENPPTFFEHLFLTSLHHFNRHSVDFAVFEVGLGGRLDATSTLVPEVAVITNISRDHTKTLGKTLRSIAYEKAGIVKPSIPVVCGCSPRSVSRHVIEQIARKKGAPFTAVVSSRRDELVVEEVNNHYRCSYTTPSSSYRFDVRLHGKHQAVNACTAIRAVEILQSRGINIPAAAIPVGIRDNFVPGRIEFLNTSPEVILDGGHNVESIRVLCEFLSQRNLEGLTLIFGVLRDKNYTRMVRMLLPFISRVVATEPVSKRALPAEKLARHFDRKPVVVKKDLQEAFDTARGYGGDILITGSLYLVGTMRNIILGEDEHGYN